MSHPSYAAPEVQPMLAATGVNAVDVLLVIAALSMIFVGFGLVLLGGRAPSLAGADPAIYGDEGAQPPQLA